MTTDPQFRYANEISDGTRKLRHARCPHCLRSIPVVALGKSHKRTGFKLLHHNRFRGSRCEGSGATVPNPEEEGS